MHFKGGRGLMVLVLWRLSDPEDALHVIEDALLGLKRVYQAKSI